MWLLANIIRQQIELSFGVKEKINPLLTYSKTKGGGKKRHNKLAEYSTEILDLSIKVNSIILFIFYLALVSLLQIYEVSNDPETIEKYLWTSKVL